MAIPKGFFPEQDTGLIIGLSEAAQDISFQAMAERQQALLNALVRDPAVASVGAAVGAGGGKGGCPADKHRQARGEFCDPGLVQRGDVGNRLSVAPGAADDLYAKGTFIP